MHYTYLTVLSTDNYLDGVLVLYQSLKHTHTRYPFTVLITGEVSNTTEERLKQYDLEVIKIQEKISLPEAVKQKNVDANFPHWNETLNKLFMFELTQFDKIVYLDSDMLVLENIDELFNKPHMAAAVAGKKYPGHENWTKLNSGIMVLEPKQGMINEFMRILPSVIQKKEYFGDQDIIQEYYNRWENDKSLELDERYNLFFSYVPYYIKNLGYKLASDDHEQNIAVIHFIGKNKPWMRKKLGLRFKLKSMLLTLQGKDITTRQILVRYHEILNTL